MVRAACSYDRRPTGSPGQDRVPRGRWADLSGSRYPLIDGVAVVSASPETGVTTAEQLRMALLEADRHRHATVVVDMSRTRFCDLAGGVS